MCVHVYRASVSVSMYTVHWRGCMCAYVHGGICVCAMRGVSGLTPQMDKVRWDDEEDENVLYPVKEQPAKQFLRGEEGQQTLAEVTQLHIWTSL